MFSLAAGIRDRVAFFEEVAIWHELSNLTESGSFDKSRVPINYGMFGVTFQLIPELVYRASLAASPATVVWTINFGSLSASAGANSANGQMSSS
jgi:hypothetical protein